MKMELNMKQNLTQKSGREEANPPCPPASHRSALPTRLCNKKRRLRRIPAILAALLLLLAAAFFAYTQDYYHAAPEALAALESDETVAISETDYGWFFDGPSETDLLAFYPGAKVEAEAYAPFLHLLAANGIDVCLVRMPLRLAIFGKDRADALWSKYTHPNRYIGGHSLGGAIASEYAARHADLLSGLVLCASYPVEPLPESLRTIQIYGSRDTVLNPKRMERASAFFPESAAITVLPGANHAGFGNYGTQKGDGTPSLPPEKQQKEAAEKICSFLFEKEQP